MATRLPVKDEYFVESVPHVELAGEMPHLIRIQVRPQTLPPAPEWGSGGRRFESGRPDFCVPSGITGDTPNLLSPHILIHKLSSSPISTICPFPYLSPYTIASTAFAFLFPECNDERKEVT